MEYTIDATDKVLGRLASEIALLLQGKRAPADGRRPEGQVIVYHAEKLRVTGRKMQQKRYYRHSGYPGGIRSEKLAERFARDPAGVLHHAVEGMLPKNRLRARRLKKLTIRTGAV